MAFQKPLFDSNKRRSLKRMGAVAFGTLGAAMFAKSVFGIWKNRKRKIAEFEALQRRFEEKGIKHHADDWVKLSRIYDLSPDNENSLRFAHETNRIAIKRAMEPAKVLLILEEQPNLANLEIQPDLPYL